MAVGSDTAVEIPDESALDTVNLISHWRSIITLVVYVLISEYSRARLATCRRGARQLTPWQTSTSSSLSRPHLHPAGAGECLLLDALSALPVIPTRRDRFQHGVEDDHDDDNDNNNNGKLEPWVRLNFPMNVVTVPLMVDLFLLAILAIGRSEVHVGTIGADNISPIGIMVFITTLAYIAISIDASGLIRYFAFKVL
ncbi:hypothetical protein TOPH_00819 [Tolypocladium ophioglossoides CBS 100239]|uniref:Uncharacterized protein n=1 Tax=Tolypocladium ophioglossoides (strain CBS 100239) TaxID=1163406 RepID=A0A0L0NKM3_TOLOC|nr:hypothetical protein TOPH_00819 [Tolypocladium ophioglossoides CBS 100239]